MKRPAQTKFAEKSQLQKSKDFLEKCIDEDNFTITANSITPSAALTTWLKSYGWELVPEFQDNVKYFNITPI